KDKHCCADSCVGLEHPRGQANHTLKLVILHQHAADSRVGGAAAKEHPIRDNHRTATTVLEDTGHEHQEKQFGLAGLSNRRQTLKHILVINCPLKRWIGQHHIEVALIILRDFRLL